MGGVAGILRMLLLLLRMLLLMKELFRTCVCSCCVSECACLRCFPFFSSLALALPAPCRVVFSVPCHLARTEHDRIQENKTRQTQKHASQRHDTQRNDTQRDTMRSEIGKTDATEIFSFFVLVRPLRRLGVNQKKDTISTRSLHTQNTTYTDRHTMQTD